MHETRFVENRQDGTYEDERVVEVRGNNDKVGLEDGDGVRDDNGVEDEWVSDSGGMI